MINQYKQKIETALEIADTISQISYIENKIKTTSQINRHTKSGRQLTNQLLILSQKRAEQLIKQGIAPF